MIDPADLLASEVVANATMNRERGLAGVNSYQKELRFDISSFLQARAAAQGNAVWYDACCGTGRALAEADEQFAEADWGDKVQIIGADLVGMFVEEMPANVRLLTGDVTELSLDPPADLITCVHGIHYLGDKLGFIEQAYRNLAPQGVFLGHLDTANLRIPMPWPRLLMQTRGQGTDMNLRTHLLRITRTERPLQFGLSYQGATVSDRPNCTGITVIDSWYSQPPAQPQLV